MTFSIRFISLALAFLLCGSMNTHALKKEKVAEVGKLIDQFLNKRNKDLSAECAFKRVKALAHKEDAKLEKLFADLLTMQSVTKIALTIKKHLGDFPKSIKDKFDAFTEDQIVDVLRMRSGLNGKVACDKHKDEL